MLAWVQKIVGVIGRFRTPVCSDARALAMNTRRSRKGGIERPESEHSWWRKMLANSKIVVRAALDDHGGNVLVRQL